MILYRPALTECLPVSLLVACTGLCSAMAAELDVMVTPRTTVVARDGITGGGHPVGAGERTLLLYANHKDDFGGSFGTASAFSTDDGLTWEQGSEEWPLPKMIALWVDRLASGDLVALGIHWVPDPKRRRESPPQTPPADAYQIAVSKDHGLSWTAMEMVIDCPPEIGVVARPLPHILETKDGDWLMPAYAWSKRGNSAVLLQSKDHGRHWRVRSVVTTPTAMAKIGARVSTPWLETAISPTSDGALLAIVRTGSNAKSSLVSVRSTDHGRTWGEPEKLPFAGKFPGLNLLPNGMLTLVTALTKNHCRLYLSEDGTGRTWSPAHVISSLTGGNIGVTIAGPNELLITTPANRRIDAWSVRIGPRAEPAPDLAPPTNIVMRKGILIWTASANATAYRVTPILIKPGPLYEETEILPYATTQTRDAQPRLELRRQLLLGSVYAFEIAAVDAAGRVSPTARSQDIQR
ncbi:MAG: exo-alpha-sialidase [Lentisphaerae bacterium]|jgi:hypothetical protein|nr:exo-alpha-sialidase [Lentisphaerota bacterium]MBT5607880.1 exo-alpha-sialidase [Lentisphaerota bacterium]MBT7058271.1 exo-alpha-sialidase [Lentisphaerota bacterium]MBT7842801.1 exo-alpha-sialidase [Lentisphaerota bacterium]